MKFRFTSSRLDEARFPSRPGLLLNTRAIEVTIPVAKRNASSLYATSAGAPLRCWRPGDRRDRHRFRLPPPGPRVACLAGVEPSRSCVS
jgi:hypothetical protein